MKYSLSEQLIVRFISRVMLDFPVRFIYLFIFYIEIKLCLYNKLYFVR